MNLHFQEESATETMDRAVDGLSHKFTQLHSWKIFFGELQECCRHVPHKLKVQIGSEHSVDDNHPAIISYRAESASPESDFSTVFTHLFFQLYSVNIIAGNQHFYYDLNRL